MLDHVFVREMFRKRTRFVLFLGGSKVIASCALQTFDLFFSHVDEQAQVGGVSPETNLGLG